MTKTRKTPNKTKKFLNVYALFNKTKYDSYVLEPGKNIFHIFRRVIPADRFEIV